MATHLKLPSDIVRLRRVIDAANHALRVAAIARLRAAVMIGKFKEKHGIKGLDRGRERAMRVRMLGGLRGAEREAVERVFDAVLATGRAAVVRKRPRPRSRVASHGDGVRRGNASRHQ